MWYLKVLSTLLPVENEVVQFDKLAADAVQNIPLFAGLAVGLYIQPKGDKNYTYKRGKNSATYSITKSDF